MLKLADGLNIEKANRNYFIISESSEQIIILKDREVKILEMILNEDVESVIRKLKNEYVGEGIEEDVWDFCNKLMALGVLKKI